MYKRQALLRRLGEKSGVTLHIYNRKVSVAEEDKIIPVSYTHLDVYKRQADIRPRWMCWENVPYALQHIRDIMNRNQLCIAPP